MQAFTAGRGYFPHRSCVITFLLLPEKISILSCPFSHDIMGAAQGDGLYIGAFWAVQTCASLLVCLGSLSALSCCMTVCSPLQPSLQQSPWACRQHWHDSTGWLKKTARQQQTNSSMVPCCSMLTVSWLRLQRLQVPWPPQERSERGRGAQLELSV